MFRTCLIAALAITAGCVRLPTGVEPVSPFEAERYLGTWYEVARLDHSFERGLSQVTAEYSSGEDGTITVINRGCHAEKAEWDQAEGTARFVEGTDTGFLKVSFFGPFYGTYAVFGLDEDYQHAFVSGPNHDYLWLLAREPNPGEEVKQAFVDAASKRGFPVDELIWVEQGNSACQ